MSRQTFRLALVGGIGLTVLIAILMVGWFLNAGTVRLQITGGDHRPIHLVIPGAFVQAGLFFLPATALAEVDAASSTAGAAWRPLLGAACTTLARGPEGEYVRVESADERVIISKTRRHLLVRVESAAEQLRLEIPLRSLRSIGRQLGDR